MYRMVYPYGLCMSTVSLWHGLALLLSLSQAVAFCTHHILLNVRHV